MILLISETPVAGTVSRLARWIGRLSGRQCHALVRKNYPHNAFRLPEGAFGALPDWQKVLSDCVRKASAIVLHNICDEELLYLILWARNPSAPLIYQYHSPPYEGPQFDYDVLRRHSYDAVFAVAQGHGRFVRGAVPVPNVVPDMTTPLPISREKTIFVPHLRSTSCRWSSKFTESDAKTLASVRSRLGPYRVTNLKEAFGREVVTHEEVLLYLRSVTAVVDDINTGLIHQTALEALKAGCAVFSAADLRSIEEFCVAADADAPPFIEVRGVDEVISLLMGADFPLRTKRIAKLAEDYATRFLGEERLARQYYKALLPYLR